jgi:hypothetical protein
MVVVALLALLGGPIGLDRALAGQDLTAMTNADRMSQGLKSLSTANDLQSLAQQRANEMARSGILAHTTNLGSKVSGWQRLGENVGRGPKLSDIETAFMNSPSHRENILDPAFTQLGVGVTFDGGKYFYVAVIFRQPSGGAPASAPPGPAPAPAPRAAASPRPAPRPAPTTTTTRAPTTTTTQAPTTTTTAPPPVEVLAAPPVETPPAPVETTTTTAPRPIFTNLDFLAANFSDRIVPKPASAVTPAGRRPSLPVMTAFGLLAVTGGGHAAVRLGSRRSPKVRPIGAARLSGPAPDRRRWVGAICGAEPHTTDEDFITG